MPEFKKFFVDVYNRETHQTEKAVLLTNELLIQAALPKIDTTFGRNDVILGNKIELIKWYRQVSGVGLKEAKDAVEQGCWCSPSNPGGYFVGVDPTKVIAVFAPFLGPFDTEAELAAKDEKRKEMEQNARIKSGIATACNKWQVLGFKNKFDACVMVLDNFLNTET